MTTHQQVGTDDTVLLIRKLALPLTALTNVTITCNQQYDAEVAAVPPVQQLWIETGQQYWHAYRVLADLEMPGKILLATNISLRGVSPGFDASNPPVLSANVTVTVPKSVTESLRPYYIDMGGTIPAIEVKRGILVRGELTMFVMRISDITRTTTRKNHSMCCMVTACMNAALHLCAAMLKP